MFSSHVSYFKAALLSLLIAALLLSSTALAASQPPVQDGSTVFLPLVAAAPQDAASQFLNAIGGTDNVFHVSASLLFLGRGHTLALIDSSNPGNPRLLTQLQLPAAPTFLAVQGDYAYLTLGDAGLAVLDLTSPAQARLLSRLPLSGTSRSLLLSPDYAYISSSQALYVVDIRHPESPRLVGSAALNAGAAQFHESLIFVSTELGFALVDVSIPSAPAIVSNFENYWSYGIIAVHGNAVYMNGFGCGILGCDYYIDIIDISNPASPIYLSIFNTWTSPGAIIFNGEIAYVTDGSDIVITQVASDGSLTELSRFQGETGSGIFLLENNRLYLGTSTTLEIFNVSDAVHPKQIDAYTIPGYTTENRQPAIPYIYYRAIPSAGSSQDLHLLVLDVSDPDDIDLRSATPFTSFNLPPAFAAQQIDLDGQLLGATSPTGESINFYPMLSLRVFDLGQPLQPVEIANYLPNGGVWFEDLQGSVQISGTLGFIMTYWRDLEIVDFSQPGAPELLSSYLANARLVSVDGSIAYIVDEVAGSNNNGLHLLALDISDPRNPTLISDYLLTPAFSGYQYAFKVSQGIACFAFPGSLRLLDYRDPANPVELSVLPSGSDLAPTTLDVADGLLVYNLGNMVKVIDVSTPLTPTWQADFDAGGNVSSIQILDQRAYLASSAGAVVVDLRDPAQPVPLKSYPGEAISIRTQPAYPLYISRYWNGIEIYRPSP